MASTTDESSVVRIAAGFSFLAFAGWAASVVATLMQTFSTGESGVHFLASHPFALVINAAIAGAFLWAALLLNANRWQGAAIVAVLGIYRVVVAIVLRPTQLGVGDALSVVLVIVALIAMRTLRRRRDTTPNANTR